MNKNENKNRTGQDMIEQLITCTCIVPDDDDDDDDVDAFGLDSTVFTAGTGDGPGSIDLFRDMALQGMLPHSRCSSVNIKRLATPANNPDVQPSVVLASLCSTNETHRRNRRCSTLSLWPPLLPLPLPPPKPPTPSFVACDRDWWVATTGDNDDEDNDDEEEEEDAQPLRRQLCKQFHVFHESGP